MINYICRQQGKIPASAEEKKKKKTEGIYTLLMSFELSKISQIGPEV